MITKLISGGQTGADLGGLEAAYALNIETGGTAPKGYRTEAGAMPILRTRFKLTQGASSDYVERTKQNVQDADLTVVFGHTRSPGSKLTVRTCRILGKPVLINPDVATLRKWLVHDPHVYVVNIAGNRESRNPGIQAGVRWLLMHVLAPRSYATPSKLRFDQ